jgi:hypothetical protein
MEVCGQRHAPVSLHTGKGPGTHCAGGWLDLLVKLDGFRNSRLH